MDLSSKSYKELLDFCNHREPILQEKAINQLCDRITTKDIKQREIAEEAMMKESGVRRLIELLPLIKGNNTVQPKLLTVLEILVQKESSKDTLRMIGGFKVLVETFGAPTPVGSSPSGNTSPRQLDYQILLLKILFHLVTNGIDPSIIYRYSISKYIYIYNIEIYIHMFLLFCILILFSPFFRLVLLTNNQRRIAKRLELLKDCLFYCPSSIIRQPRIKSTKILPSELSKRLPEIVSDHCKRMDEIP